MKGLSGVIKINEAPVFLYSTFNDKFSEEKVNGENDKYIVQFDGILLNYGKPTTYRERFECFCDLYDKFKTDIVMHIKGAFNLIIYNKEEQTLFLANDALGNHPFYYYANETSFYYASSYYDLLSLLSKDNVNYLTLNQSAVQSMISNGFLIGEETYISEIKYLDAFQYIILNKKNVEFKVVYYFPEDLEQTYSIDEAAKRFDELFDSAIEAQFKKNEEYGYDHLISLSGGMDSRATLLKALTKGYGDRHILCFNYSQSTSMDHVVSEKISIDYSLDYLHYPMDAAPFIKNIDDIMDCNECQQSCIGSTGARTMSKLLDCRTFGIIHTGLCGGELLGDLLEQKNKNQSTIKLIIVRLGLFKEEHHNNLRKYFDYVRGCYNFSSMFNKQCEIFSPFLDPDIIRFVFSLNSQLLFRRKMYRYWMNKYLPNEYPTTFCCGQINISPFREYLKKELMIIYKKLSKNKITTIEMNPINLWVNTHQNLGLFLSEKYTNGKEIISFIKDEELLQMIDNNWNSNWVKRLYILTAIRAINDIKNIVDIKKR